MAELSTLEEKLAEVTGLAGAAKDLSEKVASMIEDEKIRGKLERMAEEAAETDDRCSAVIDAREGGKTAILEKAQETKTEASEMASTYLGEDSDGLDGLEFMTMAEAGEVGHWAILGKLNEQAGEGEVGELASSGRCRSKNATSTTSRRARWRSPPMRTPTTEGEDMRALILNCTLKASPEESTPLPWRRSSPTRCALKTSRWTKSARSITSSRGGRIGDRRGGRVALAVAALAAKPIPAPPSD